MCGERLRALVVDDDLETLAVLSEAEGSDVQRACSLAAAGSALDGELPDVVLSDQMLDDGLGTSLLEIEDAVEAILVTGHSSVETAVEALRLGAYGCLTKPIATARLCSLLAASALAAAEAEGLVPEPA